VIPYDEAALAEALIGVLQNPHRQKQLRESARRVGVRSDWTSVFDRAFTELPLVSP
jgi:hypothetical protein